MTDSSVLPSPAAVGASRRSLVDELQGVLEHAAGQSIKIEEIVTVLKHRGPAMVMLLLSLPFVIPVPLPGLSTPLGLAIMVYGVQVTFRMRPWVPGFIRNRTLKYGTLEKLVGVASRGGRKVERLLRPRLKFMLWPAVDVPIGLSIAFCGFFLGLPLPIPFTNAIPAVALILLFLGVIERDGVAVILGEIITLLILALCVYVVYLFVKLGVGGGWDELRRFGHWLTPGFLRSHTTP